MQVIQLFTSSPSAPGITAAEFVDAYAAGKSLPDLGVGPGHHGDAEYEYEIHHFELFHDENSKEEDLVHPEDIEHFRMHDIWDEEAEHNHEQELRPIVEENIPNKFRRGA